jgi:DEAD/DEAH box helicase domain-containing protein
MLPSVISNQVQRGVVNFLKTTFPVTNPFFAGFFDRFLDREAERMFKGPYVSVKLPFRSGTSGRDYYPEIPMAFPPYRHQQTAYERLGDDESTIVATGTGSGKTECFMMPILDHCRRMAPRKGIKALIIYPMNALANNQAKRFAEEIHRCDALRGQLRVGMYIGDKKGGSGSTAMLPNQVITDRETMQNNPPDILLTNYKMLDYMLVRPKDAKIWRDNDPESLKFLVVDELHTFDGAQGTDLACLIRRLKSRLATPKTHLTCVGTSATLGEDDKSTLCEYAATIFDEPFAESAIIVEDLLQPDEFFGDSLINARYPVPDESDLAKLRPDTYDSQEAYIQAQAGLWFPFAVEDISDPAWRRDLGKELKSHPFFRNLLSVLTRKRSKLEEIIQEFDRLDRIFRESGPDYKECLLHSLLALVSWARNENNGPFLQVRLQVWMRELRRLVGDIKTEPTLKFSSDLPPEESKRSLPVVHCRECGAMGWVGVMKKQDNQLNSDLKDIYPAFFQDSPTIQYVFPLDHQEPSEELLKSYLCSECLNLNRGDGGECDACGGTSLIPVYEHHPRVSHNYNGNSVSKSSNDCPFCGGRKSLTIIGSQAASLISVANSVLFASRFNDDKKLLTFSDSVQDAAHRAGFFTARTYRFNLRAAIQQFLQDYEGPPLRLSGLSQKFCDHYYAKWGQLAWISNLLPPDLAWFEDYENLKQTGQLPEGSYLETDIRRRLDWELYSEFCFRSRVGRTLEKTGCSIAYVDPSLIRQVAQTVLEEIRNRIGILRDVRTADLEQFIAGFLAVQKQKGGVAEGFLKSYIESSGTPYLLSKDRLYMPNFGRRSRAPGFVSNKRSERFDPLLSAGTTRTWYQDWVHRHFLKYHPAAGDYSEAFYQILLPALETAGVLKKYEPTNGLAIWGIAPEALLISRNVSQLRCKTCSHSISVAQEELAIFDGEHCLKGQCQGAYEILTEDENYYGRLYSHGDIQRIYAQEHTGLLGREEREELEAHFMAKARQPWDTNLLSCTPTLEMGVDIGDLSSAILCSMPPRQASYLQRIGRTGRKDGNSFNLVVANSKPHDLYFFQEPLEMMAGKVEPPGCFLNAPAVLERQFTAFALDNWVQSGVTPEQIPAKLGKVLDNVEKQKKNEFPYSFLTYLNLHRLELFERFLTLFPAMPQDCVERLRSFVESSESRDSASFLDYRIVDGLRQTAKERASLKVRIKQITKVINDYLNDSARPQNWEEIVEDLKTEKAALNEIARSIVGKETYNFFTDEGLLPNYAFPEAGVVLRSIILKKKKKPDPKSQYSALVYEYERPGTQALRELAPSNVFYAEGRRVKIDQVDMRLSEIEDWRFCSQCSHMELVQGDIIHNACPKCGSTQWADETQKRQMVRMRQVMATESDRDSRISDDSDERELTYFNKNLIVEPTTELPEAAFKLDCEELPFGFEYLQKVSFREINFGKTEDLGETMSIAGQDVFKNAFTICRYCGQVQGLKRGRNNQEVQHAITCKHRHTSKEQDLFRCIFLYRDFRSEAIRILLPLASFSGCDEGLQSFIAAVVLGLKLKFRGNIDHIQTTIQEEPILDSNFTKKYLVLYDQVPGGTGYLKELMNKPESMLELFRLALEHIRTCPCQKDPEKDGCYRCVYAYKNSFDIPEISRNAAMDILQRILKYEDKLIKTDTISTISQNALFESVLEEMFIEALRQIRYQDKPARLKVDVVKDKPGYQLRLGDRVYFIEVQVPLGIDQGVAIPSRADFVIHPEKESGGKPIAVFTDGYEWHGKLKDETSRTSLDLAQRMAILRSGKYRIWSLTYNDVDHALNNRKGESWYENYVLTKGLYQSAKLSKFLAAKDKAYGTKKLSDLHQCGSFEMLVRFLADPQEKRWQCYAYLQGFLMLNPQTPANQAWLDQTVELFNDDKLIHKRVPSEGSGGQEYLTGVRAEHYQDDMAQIYMLSAIERAQCNDMTRMRFYCRLLDDSQAASKAEYPKVWAGVLRLFNLFQFLHDVWFVSSQGLAQGIYQPLEFIQTQEAPVEIPGKLISGEATELLGIADEATHEIIITCARLGLPLPEIGCEVMGVHKNVVAEVEMGWPEIKLTCLLDSELGQAPAIKGLGWHVLALKDVAANFKLLQELLSPRNS